MVHELVENCPERPVERNEPDRNTNQDNLQTDKSTMAGSLAFFTELVGIVVLILTFIWTYKYRGGAAWEAENKQLIFNLHPILMVVSFVFLYSQAILAYRILPGSKSFKKAVHTLVQLAAFVLAVIGISAAVKYHNELNIPNFYSLHSWFGLATIVLFAVQWLGGLLLFFFPGTSKPTRRKALPWHTFLGLFIYVLALATASQGLLEKLTFLFAGGLDKRGPEAILANILGLLLFGFGGLVILTAVQVERDEDDEAFHPLD